MRNRNQKPANCYVCAAESGRFSESSLRCCAIIALLMGLVLCDRATACPQFGGGGFAGGGYGSGNHNQNQVRVGTTDANGETWSSVSDAALRTEAILRQPPTVALRNASTFADAMEAFQAMGVDVVLTNSASDDALTTDEEWEMIGDSNETGATLSRYLRSRNAVFSVSKRGAIEIISRDEMNDEVYFQTVIYRVDNLASNDIELRGLAQQIQESLRTEDWESSGGGATMQPRIQSGHRLLIVSIHYHYQVMLRQFFYELAIVSSGPNAVRSRSSVAGVGAAPQTLSRLVDVPGTSDSSPRKSRGSMVLGVPQAAQSGGVF